MIISRKIFQYSPHQKDTVNEILRIPIKINNGCLPSWLRGYFHDKEDLRKLLAPGTCADDFESCITAMKIGATWKTTSRNRQILTDRLIIEATTRSNSLSFLEIGASAGSTSLELLNLLGENYNRYYVTDLYFFIKAVEQPSVTYFYHPFTRQCIMRVSNLFLVYDDIEHAVFPLGSISSRLLSGAPNLDSSAPITVNLLHPELRQRVLIDPRIVVQEYNVFEPWPYGSVHIVKVANLLNRAYFSDADIVKALTNLKNAINPGGKLVITDNRKIEKVALYSKSLGGGLVLEKAINGGTEIADLVTSV